MAGFKVWVPGEEVLADDMNGFLQTQVIPVFTTTAQRDSQWPTPPQGAHCYVTALNRLQQYNGVAWGNLAGAPVAWAAGGAGGTSGGALAIIDANFPAQAVPGMLTVNVYVRCDFNNGTSYQIDLLIAGAAQARRSFMASERAAGQIRVVTMSGSGATTAGAATRVQVSGSGVANITTFGDPLVNRVDAIWTAT
jgi:hypothetical protein